MRYPLIGRCLLIMRCNAPSSPIPTMTAQIYAFTPFLAARTAPGMAPLVMEVMEFHGSSLSRREIRAQSKVEYRPPHTAKFPEERRDNFQIFEVVIYEILIQFHKYTKKQLRQSKI